MRNTFAKLVFPALFGLMVAAAAVPAHAAPQMYIGISDNSYSNTVVGLPVGTTVTWTNTGRNNHTVTADDGSFDSGIIAPNQTYVRTFSASGTFAYHDRFYGASGGIGMSATIVVGNGQSGSIYPSCAPASSNINVNGSVQFSASGGDGTNYTWNATNATPSYGTGGWFTTSFYVAGTQTVTVSSNGYTSTCTVQVSGPFVGTAAPTCTPSTQSANLNDLVNFTAMGGNGSYYWIASDGNPSSGNAATFSTRFATPGTKTITLTSNGQNSQCTVNVGGQVLGVSNVVTGPEDIALWALALGLLGAMGGYWYFSRRYLKA